MAEQKPVILVVDDEAPIQRFLKASLEDQGYRVVQAKDGSEALSLTASHRPDLILLDLGLPDMDGLEVLRKVRKSAAVPVIILSARGQERDKVLGLDSGADDYLTKPFSAEELNARLRVALRHKLAAGGAKESLIDLGALKVDLEKRMALKGGKEIRLTRHEYQILSILAMNAGKLVTQARLLREVWGPGKAESGHYLRIYIHQLRKKLEDVPARPRWLLTEPGIGYRLRLDQV